MSRPRKTTSEPDADRHPHFIKSQRGAKDDSGLPGKQVIQI
jgi:hypothetical protein